MFLARFARSLFASHSSFSSQGSLASLAHLNEAAVETQHPVPVDCAFALRRFNAGQRHAAKRLKGQVKVNEQPSNTTGKVVLDQGLEFHLCNLLVIFFAHSSIFTHLGVLQIY